MINQNEFYGWIVTKDGQAPRGVPAHLADQMSRNNTLTLTKGDPDDSDFMFVHIGGEEGIDPDILMERAQLAALQEDVWAEERAALKREKIDVPSAGSPLPHMVGRFQNGDMSHEDLTIIISYISEAEDVSSIQKRYKKHAIKVQAHKIARATIRAQEEAAIADDGDDE